MVIVIREAKNSCRCIGTYSRKFFQSLFLPRKYAVIFFHHYFGRFQHISSPSIVAEALVVWKKLFPRGFGKLLYCRKLFEEAIVVLHHSIHLSLLEHNFRNPHFIRGNTFLPTQSSPARHAPRQVLAPGLPEKIQKPLFKKLNLLLSYEHIIKP